MKWWWVCGALNSWNGKSLWHSGFIRWSLCKQNLWRLWIHEMESVVLWSHGMEFMKLNLQWSSEFVNSSLWFRVWAIGVHDTSDSFYDTPPLHSFETVYHCHFALLCAKCQFFGCNWIVETLFPVLWFLFGSKRDCACSKTGHVSTSFWFLPVLWGNGQGHRQYWNKHRCKVKPESGPDSNNARSQGHYTVLKLTISFHFFPWYPLVGITGKKTTKDMQKLTNFFPFFLMIPLGTRGKMQRRALWKTEISFSGEFKVGSSRGMRVLDQRAMPSQWLALSQWCSNWIRWWLIAKLYFSTGLWCMEKLKPSIRTKYSNLLCPFGLYLEKLQILQWVAWTLNAPKCVSLSTGI